MAQLVIVHGIDPGTVAVAAGAQAYAKGIAAVRERRILHSEWDAFDSVVRGLVRDDSRAELGVQVFFDSRRGRLHFAFSDCECGSAKVCEHAVALTLSAAGISFGKTAAPAARVEAARPWEQALQAVLGETGPSRVAANHERAALAIELTARFPQFRPRTASGYVAGTGPALLARLVRPGHNGWIAGGLSWNKLPLTYLWDDFPHAQVALLQELYALHHVHAGRDYATLQYGADEKHLDLASFNSHRLWDLLDEAAATGIQLVHARRQLGPVPPPGQATLEIDVTADSTEGGLSITPRLRVGDGTDAADPELAFFIGATGHGVVWVPGEKADPDPAHWPLRLARLTEPAPPALQQMALEGRRLTIPGEGRERFAGEFYPRLRRLAQVTSSDGSFTPPSISDPTLVLRADYGDDHELDLSWEWSYEVDGSAVRAAPAGSEGFRDPAKEQAVLRSLEQIGLGTPEPRRLAGLETMRFATELTPLLDGSDDVRVEVVGTPARYREAGDSLRIGLSTDTVAGDNDWFDLGVDITVEGRSVPFAAVFTALDAGESHMLLLDGAYFSLLKPELQALRTLIDEARGLQERPGDPLRLSRFQAGLWEELVALGVVEHQAAVWREQVGALAGLEQLDAAELPAGLHAQLRPYQREGYEWLSLLHRHGLGGILADDMGLGKTVQTLALICQAREQEPDGAPFLVVAPTSVVTNWAVEAARFTPGLRVVPITDTLRRRGQELDEAIAGADIVVTSYTLLRLDAEAYCAREWSGLVLDEAQFVKNHQAKVHQAVRRVPAPFRLAITGTPMENNLMELWALLSVTAPGLFPSPTRFKEHYARPIEKGGDPERLATLRRRVRPLMRRRTKEQVAAELPSKQEQVLEIELEPRHRRLYERHLQRERQKVLGLLADVDRNRFTILRSLTLLRQLSLHPGLVDPEHDKLGSAKIEALVEQLGDVVGGGHRALVFSQFTGFLAHVKDRLDQAGISYVYLDGSTRNRQAVITQFTEGSAPVFLISLKAGGFGLNLTQADYCFLLDPWWNPATEAQAVDRTHRIGQTRTVMVYRMISANTIEEKVLALSRRKAALFTGVMDEGNLFSTELTAEDISELLS